MAAFNGAGNVNQYKGVQKTIISARSSMGANRAKSSSKEQALPVVKHFLQAAQPLIFMLFVSNNIIVCPAALAPSIKAFASKMLFPSFLGLPVRTSMSFIINSLRFYWMHLVFSRPLGRFNVVLQPICR
jgi:hypothetical protein